MVVLAVLAPACASSTGAVAGSRADEPTATEAGTELAVCDDIDPLGSSKSGVLGSRTNPDDLLMGVLRTYAQEHPATYAGLWIDRESDGVIVVAFTDDPEPHRNELLSRGPTEADDVGVSPRPPITDPRPLGEREDFVFDVIRVAHSEATLQAAQESVSSLSGVEGTGVSSSGVDTSKNIVSLELIDPTDAGLDAVAEATQGRPVCISILRSPTPPAGALDIIPAAGEPFVLPAGLGEVRWELDPAFPAPGPDDTEIHVLATEVGCASGRDMGDALRGPQVIETDTEVVIAFAVEVDFGPQNCQGNPSTPVTVMLDAPLADRSLRNGADSSSQHAEPEPPVPTVDQPDGGDGWRMVSSSHVIDEWNPPVAATSQDEFWLLTDTFWELGLDNTDFDFDREILIAQTVIKQLGKDQRCGPHVMDNVRIEGAEFRFDLTSPLHLDDDPCVDPDSYQVFVVALDRDRLPDMILLPSRGALIEVRIR